MNANADRQTMDCETVKDICWAGFSAHSGEIKHHAERPVHRPGGSLTSTAVLGFKVDLGSLFAA